MIKKIILVFVLIFSFFIGNNVFAEKRCIEKLGCSTSWGDITPDAGGNSGDPNSPDFVGPPAPTGGNSGPTDSGDPSDITSKAFEIDTSLFSIGGNSLKGADSKTTINNTLGNIIKKLMIALGVIALFVMTIGAGYMILYQGHDEYLSKGKNIFIGGITALIVALSSYYLVNFIGYILYS